jgi:hypothetical protein
VNPPLVNLIFGYLLIGLAWGFTTPFIRRAAKAHVAPAHPVLARLAGDGGRQTTWWKKYIVAKMLGIWFAVTDLLRDWRYALPLVINLTGSVWFFLLVGASGEFKGLIFLSAEREGKAWCLEWI